MYTHISTGRHARVLWKSSRIPYCFLLKVIFCVVEETDQIAGGRLTDRIGIGVLTRVVPRDLVNEVLAETRRREKRSRLLPAHVVVYFVMAMAIFRDGYEEVMRWLAGWCSCGPGPGTGRCPPRGRSRRPGTGWARRRSSCCSRKSRRRWPRR